MRRVLFVGEKRSALAVTRGFTWKDGRLAAKQLFDALDALKFPRERVAFANAYERGHMRIILAHRGPIIAMGEKAQRRLTREGVRYTPMIHPAARGRIRAKDRYTAHVRSVLEAI